MFRDISLEVILRAVLGIEASELDAAAQILTEVTDGFSPLLVFIPPLQRDYGPGSPGWTRASTCRRSATGTRCSPMTHNDREGTRTLAPAGRVAKPGPEDAPPETGTDTTSYTVSADALKEIKKTTAEGPDVAKPPGFPGDRLERRDSRRARTARRNLKIRAAFMDLFGIGRKLTKKETDLVKKFLPDSFDPSVIRLRRMSRRRAARWARKNNLDDLPSGKARKNTLWLSEDYFTEDTEDSEIELNSVGAIGDFQHETFHIFQHSLGMSISRERRYAKRQGTLMPRGGDVYYYTRFADPQKMLDQFWTGTIEQQSALFGNAVKLLESETRGLEPDTDIEGLLESYEKAEGGAMPRFSPILDYVKGLR